MDNDCHTNNALRIALSEIIELSKFREAKLRCRCLCSLEQDCSLWKNKTAVCGRWLTTSLQLNLRSVWQPRELTNMVQASEQLRSHVRTGRYRASSCPSPIWSMVLPPTKLGKPRATSSHGARSKRPHHGPNSDAGDFQEISRRRCDPAGPVNTDQASIARGRSMTPPSVAFTMIDLFWTFIVPPASKPGPCSEDS
jgi:hypothetical protein